LNSLKEFGLSAKDERKMIVHLAFSLALKYNERVVPMFEDIAKKLRFEAPTSLLIGIMTPDALKKIEYEMLQRLNFRIGEGA
jgi:hypothetical protein